MYLDADIVEHFKQRAAAPNAAPYQSQINNALRQFLARGKPQADYAQLVHDDRFIEAVARRVEKRRRA